MVMVDCDDDNIPNVQENNDGTNPNDPCSSNGGTPPNGVQCDIAVPLELMSPQLNDGIFQITNIEAFPENTVRFYNRWGVLVYETQGYDNQGNGFRGISNGRVTIKQNETLPAGVYFYVIEYVKDGDRKFKDGYLYITK